MNIHAHTWPRKQLGDITTLKMGSTPSTKYHEYWINGDVLWATPSDLGRGEIIQLRDTARKITIAGLKTKRMETFPCGTVLLSTTATIGNVGIAGRPTYCNQQITAIIPNDTVLSGYLAYYLLRSKADLMRLGGTSTATHINQKNLSTLSIPVPPLAEQRRIVDILSRAEGIVRLRREAQKKAAEIIPALFINMFGDPTTNPKGWPKLPLANLCARITDGTHQPPKFEGSGIPFIFISNIICGELTFDTSKFISEETYTELTRRCPIEIGDVLYSTVGSYGVPVKVDSDRRFSFQRHIAHIKPLRDKLDSDFLVGMLSTPSLKTQADAAARGIAQKTVNLGEIRKYQVIAPPLESQRSFALLVAAARSIQSQQSAATAKAEATFNALLARAFNNNVT